MSDDATRGDGSIASPEVGWEITEAHLERARRVVHEHARRTRLVAAPALGEGVFLKLETEQDTGSFKLRGALAALARLGPAERAAGVVTASAGNHGYGLATAGARLGVPVTVYVAASAPAVKRAGIAAAGATLEVVSVGGYDDVEAAARGAAARRGLRFVSPFDDPDVAAGNGGTVALEILEDLPTVRTLVAPVGGGGLLSGIAAARQARGSTVRLVGVQSAACPAMVESFADGAPRLRFAGAPTLAEGLEGGVSKTTFAILRAALWRMDAVDERSIAHAMGFASRTLGHTIEGSAAVAVAWLLAHRDDPDLERPVVVVLTGRNVDPSAVD